MPRVARPATAAEIAATVAVLVLVTGAVAARALGRRLAAHPSAEECAALLDRYVELVARAATPAPATTVVADRQAKARATAAERGFARCESDLTRAEVACALAAGNADELERCLP